VLPNRNHLRSIHNGLRLIAAEYKQGEKYGEDAAADDHRAGEVRQHGERYAETEEVGPILLDVGEPSMQLPAHVEPLVLEGVQRIEQAQMHEAQPGAHILDGHQIN